jgi:hypothetical protein
MFVGSCASDDASDGASDGNGEIGLTPSFVCRHEKWLHGADLTSSFVCRYGKWQDKHQHHVAMVEEFLINLLHYTTSTGTP